MTAVDTDILALIFDRDPHAATLARELHRLARDGRLVLCGVVYAELLAGPGRTKARVETFLSAVDVQLDSEMGRAVWEEAGRANADYHARRRADRLCTDSARDFSDFPALTIVEASQRPTL